MKILLSLLFMVEVNFASVDEVLKKYEVFLNNIRMIVEKDGPTCFISRSYTGETDEILQYHATINEGLQRAGIKTFFDCNKGKRGLNIGDKLDDYLANINTVDFALCLFTNCYKERSKIENSGVTKEVTLIIDRLKKYDEKYDKKSGNERHFLLPFLLEKDVDKSVPDILRKRLIADHQKRDLKAIFKDIFTHLYVFYFKGHKDFSTGRGGLIKSELEQFFNDSLSTHSSLDTDTQTQRETLVSSSLSLTPSLGEDGDHEISSVSHENSDPSPSLLSSLALLSSSKNISSGVSSQFSNSF